MSQQSAQPEQSAAQANGEGMRALARADFAAAAVLFAQATSADPQAPGLWRNLAKAHRELGDDAGERAALDGALAADRTDFMAWLRKAQLHERLGEEALALQAWQGVLQMAAGFATPPPDLAGTIDHGRDFVGERTARLAAAVDAELVEPLAALDPAARRRAHAFADAAVGRRRIYDNQCAGLRYPFLPADEFFDEGNFPWFAALEARTPAIRQELEALLGEGEEWLRPYVRLDEGMPQSKWTGLDHNLAWGACFLWEYGRPNEAVLARCPRTAAALAEVPRATIPGRAPSAFFSLLKPRTRIPAHTGVSNTRAIVHLPLIVPAGCGFRVGGETRDWVEGKALAFDDTIEHEAWNDSNELRAILIVDVWNPHLTPGEQDAVVRYYAAADATGLNPEPDWRD